MSYLARLHPHCYWHWQENIWNIKCSSQLFEMLYSIPEVESSRPRGRPRGHILKSLASKVKSLALTLASRPQVLENRPVLGSRTARFFGMLKFCGALGDLFFFYLEIAWRIFVKTFFFFFWRALALCVLGLGLEHSCPWPRECLSSERLSLALASNFFCVLGLGLEPCVLDSTSALYYMTTDKPSLNTL